MLQINDDRAVVGALPPRPVIDASHMDGGHRAAFGPILACFLRPARIVVSLTGIPSRISRSEGRPPALWPSSSTPPAPEAGTNNDRRSLSGQIPERSPVSAVARFGLCAASRAERWLPAVPRDRQSLLAPFDAHNVHACRGRPCNRCFHHLLLPHTLARRHPASITGSVAPGVACTKVQSDPFGMGSRDAAALTWASRSWICVTRLRRAPNSKPLRSNCLPRRARWRSAAS